jgi:peptidoglycan L-alanyl-D-glutamate endopeptidase CwlK
MRDAQSIKMLEELHPKVRPDFQAFIEECEQQYDITLRIMSAYRDMSAQAKIYAVGRTVKGENVTDAKPFGDVISDAKPGSSWHNFGMAVDLGIVLVNGSISYNFNYMKFANIGQQWGITWGGNFPNSFKDPDHFEEQAGQTLHGLLALYNAGKFINGTQFIDF